MHPDLVNFARDLDAFIRRASRPARRYITQPLSDPDFNQLALRLFEIQRDQIPAYGRFCTARDLGSRLPGVWSEIPFVPAAAFKEFDLTCLPETDRSCVFHSSGTTAHQQARHFHNPGSLRIYESSLLPWFNAHMVPNEVRPHLVALTPAPHQAPNSSLAHMLGTVGRELAEPPPLFLGEMGPDHSWQLDADAVASRLADLSSQPQPLLLAGTAFGFVHLLDHLATRRASHRLPPGTRILETGGYKGRSRSLPKPELHRLISRLLGVPPSHIVSEYGMCELSSQAYDHTAGATPPSPRLFQFPPWAQPLILDPETGRPATNSSPGIVALLDLANVASICAVLTEDVGILHDAGLELLGRASHAEPRGCSLLHS